MVAVDTLTTKFVLDSGQYTTAASRVVAATHSVGASQSRLTKTGGAAFKSLASGANALKQTAQDVVSAFEPLKSIVLGIAGVGVAGAAAGYGLAKQAAEFDSLRQSLISVEGDAKKAGKALADLKELAKAPGLGFEEAVRGYTGLRNAGLTQDFSEKLIKEFANANARGGGNAETFGRILTQVRQAAGRKFLAQEDLSPIGEAGIPINKVLKDAFGTGDTEELKKRGIGAQEALAGIVTELSKLQRVAGGAQNAFDNAGDALKFAAVAAGDGINQSLLPILSEFATAVGELGESGEITAAFSTAASNIAEIFTGAGGTIKDALRGVLVGIETAAAGFRNLTLNAIEFFDRATKAATNTPAGFAARAYKYITGGKDDEFDDSLSGEWKRNMDAAERQASVQKDRDEAAAAGYKGFLGTWQKMSPAQKKAFKEENDRKTQGQAKATPEDAKRDKQVTLLERIAINTGRMVEALDDATSGGGALSDARSSVKELSGVQGGYNRRFRRMGA